MSCFASLCLYEAAANIYRSHDPVGHAIERELEKMYYMRVVRVEEEYALYTQICGLHDDLTSTEVYQNIFEVNKSWLVQETRSQVVIKNSYHQPRGGQLSAGVSRTWSGSKWYYQR